MPLRLVIEPLEPRRLLSAVLATVGTQPAGALTGKIVYTSAGHGFVGNTSGVWSTQRGETNNIVEDLGNYDQMTFYVEHLWRAGATVVPMRPVGHQTGEVVIDDQQAVYSGSWTSDTTSSPYFSTTNGSGIRYRTALGSATETAVARFRPNLPTTGHYPVYAWAADGTDRMADQLYRVNHSGGATEVKVDHTRVGKGWVYLGTYSFRAGTSGSVEVSNRTAGPTTRRAVADAVRFGNGMGTIARNGLTSGLSREDEASLYWIEAQAGWTGAGTRVASINWRELSNDGEANVGAPLRWAEYMNAAPFAQSVYLSFHSNGGGGRGADGLYNDESLFPGTATPNQLAWATLVGKEVNDDLVAMGSPPLENAFQNSANPVFARSDFAFGEIRGDTNGDEFDATIIEVAYHDHALDATTLRDPIARDRVGQSATQATIRYFNRFATAPLVFAPDAPGNLRTSVDRSGNVTLRWDAPPTGTVFGGTPSGYRLYASRDGYGFDGGVAIAGSARLHTIPAAQVGAGTIYLRLVATNAGGESPPSGVVAVRAGDSRVGRVLIVNGYDRLRRAQNVLQTLALFGTNENGPQAELATVERVRPREMNSFDYAVQHAQAIASHAADVGVDTVDNEAVIRGNVNLPSYRAVIWISGQESTQDRTFDPAEQSAVAGYLSVGGRIFVSGSEVGWDLQAQGNGVGFFNNTLHAAYAGDDANTYAAAGASGSIFDGIALNFDDGSLVYDVAYPDRLATINGSVGILNYLGGTGGLAATSWTGGNGARSIVMGFGFETITTSGARALLMSRVLDAFGFVPASTPIPDGIETMPSPTQQVAARRRIALSVLA